MGIFLLCRNSILPSAASGANAISKFGFAKPVIRNYQSFTLYIYKKLIEKDFQCFETATASIFGIGTFIYKGLPLKNITGAILTDFENGRLDQSRLIGHYFIFIFSNGKFTILNDGTSLISAYYDVNGSFLTSSFISASLLLNKITLSRQTVIENLVTGGITGYDTLFNELKKFSKKSVEQFPEINFLFPTYETDVKTINNKRQALETQAEVLSNYINDCKPLADEHGADLGLTGGLDSRLLLGIINKKFIDYQVHSHRRNQYSPEWVIASSIAEKCSIPFVSPIVKPSNEYTEEDLIRTLESSYNFYDAQIRMHCNWNEEYNTLEYRLKVLNGKFLGFHGIGGEQYRNADRLCLRSWDIRKWLKYNIIRRTAGNVFTDQFSESALIEKMQSVINYQIGSAIIKNKLTLGGLKRINNEVFIPSNRGARTSAENKLSFFLSPFADFHVSRSAYEIVPFLDCTNNFEIDLIKMISPELSGFITNYGYTLNRGEPFKKYFTNALFENLVPSYANWYIREKIKHGIKGNPLRSKNGVLPIIDRYIRNITDLDLPINTGLLLNRPDTAPLVLSMGYFLEKFKCRLS